MVFLRGRGRTRQAVAPCPATAVPSTSNSFSLRASSTSHSTSSSSSRPARPSVTPLSQLPPMTDGWVCDPAISALHFSYALTRAAEDDEEADNDRHELQSPRPLLTPCESPMSVLSLDGSSPHKLSTTTATTTAATAPTHYRRVSHNMSLAAALQLEPKSSPHSPPITTARKSNDSTSPAGGGAGSGNGGKYDWLQSSLRLAFRRRTIDDTAMAAADSNVVLVKPRHSPDTLTHSAVQVTRKLSMPLPQR